MADAGAGVREMRRVVRPGGTVAACVWDYRGEMTLLRTFWDAARATDRGSGALDEGVRMGYSDPESLSALWADQELRSVVTTELRPSVRYTDFDELWNPFLAGVAPTGVYVATLDDAGQDALREEFFRGWAVRPARSNSRPGPGQSSGRDDRRQHAEDGDGPVIGMDRGCRGQSWWTTVQVVCRPDIDSPAWQGGSQRRTGNGSATPVASSRSSGSTSHCATPAAATSRGCARSTTRRPRRSRSARHAGYYHCFGCGAGRRRLRVPAGDRAPDLRRGGAAAGRAGRHHPDHDRGRHVHPVRAGHPAPAARGQQGGGRVLRRRS